MNNSKTQIGFAIVAAFILICLQAYTLTRIYKLEVDKFDNRYRELIVNELNMFDQAQAGIGLNAAQVAMDLQSKSLFDFYHKGKASDTIAFRRIALNLLHDDFEKNHEVDLLVSKILENEGINTKVDVHVLFHYFEFDSFTDTLVIYNEVNDKDWDYLASLEIPAGALPIKRVTHYGSNYSCNYEILVDFTEKTKLVLGQITGVLFIMLIALIIIGAIFIAMVRNMLEEKRLSLLKTDFINNMTHELKTPLSTIAIATKSLGKEEFASNPVKVIDTAKIINRQNKQLSKQINHLIEVSMWERKQFELDKQWVGLSEFLHDFIEAFKWEINDDKIIIRQECNIDNNLQVFIDETQIATALHNLLANGVKYNDKNPELSLVCYVDNDLIITVTDNGIGISKENTRHVFEKFYRVHTGNIHKVKGLGLGLFYVYQIVIAHGGTVELSSKLGIGSRFTIKLPINDRTKDSIG
ncbi:MAG: HAMP domain-containing histidine kinase [Bacteroidales bacterium]|nr:HAMP domain-containing histidine kinase [Bacteroidales bacterium]